MGLWFGISIETQGEVNACPSEMGRALITWEREEMGSAARNENHGSCRVEETRA